MFNDSKYTKWYYSLIAAAKLEKRNKKLDYFESHHILPRSLGGGDDIENLVLLTAREHFICHLLLTKMCISTRNQIKMHWAMHWTAFSSVLGSRDYEIARKMHSKFLRDNHHAHRIPEWGKKMRDIVQAHWDENPERKKALSEAIKRDWVINRETRLAASLKNLPEPKRGRDSQRTITIEYLGNEYFGWSDLETSTGVTRYLYNKYYKRGIDPTPRIGKDGPIGKENR